MEGLAALLVGLEADAAGPTVGVLDDRVVDRAVAVLALLDLDDVVAWDQAGSPTILLATQQLQLDDVAHRLVGVAGRPAVDRVVELEPGPPLRVDPRQVARHLVAAAALGLADPVGRHEAAGRVGAAQPEKLKMLGVELAPQRAGVRKVGPELPPRLAPFNLSQDRRQFDTLSRRQRQSGQGNP